ncbi:MAG: 3-hydroxyacyl-CoA dehydrogenase, partial [Marivita sp.]|nr:3-hydroxyacyl-CoA dehydrogenase [Marivita sp.]
WYDHSDKGAQPSELVMSIIGEERQAMGKADPSIPTEHVMPRILGAMTREAEAVLAEGIARSADHIDVVMVNGYGFPRWKGGPMFAARAVAD